MHTNYIYLPETKRSLSFWSSRNRIWIYVRDVPMPMQRTNIDRFRDASEKKVGPNPILCKLNTFRFIYSLVESKNGTHTHSENGGANITHILHFQKIHNKCIIEFIYCSFATTNFCYSINFSVQPALDECVRVSGNLRRSTDYL